jgi:hypothetical protein
LKINALLPALGGFTMRKIGLLVPVICLALVPCAAKADPVLTFNSSSGVVGPYNLTLNPPGSNLSLFCLNDTLDIQATESWTVAVINGANLSTNSLTGSSPSLLLDYEEEAYIFSKYTGGPSSAQNTIDVQDALWKIFDPADSVDTTAANWITAASTFTYTSAFLSNYTFYVYDGGTVNDPVINANGAPSAPQNFIGDAPPSPAPEPSTLLMLGTGLTGLAGVIRRKLTRT